MSFHDVRFPERLSRGSSGGPERRTEIVTLANGHEVRNAIWTHARRRFDAGVGVSATTDLMEIVAFFEARRGRLHGFRWKDWLDFSSAEPGVDVSAGDQVIGTGDGFTTAFALSKTYASGDYTYQRPIEKAVAGSVLAAVDGLVLVEGVDWSFDGQNVNFETAPPAGAAITAGYEFDVPVRFAEDVLEISLTAFEAGEIPSIPVVEVRL